MISLITVINSKQDRAIFDNQRMRLYPFIPNIRKNKSRAVCIVPKYNSSDDIENIDNINNTGIIDDIARSSIAIYNIYYIYNVYLRLPKLRSPNSMTIDINWVILGSGENMEFECLHITLHSLMATWWKSLQREHFQTGWSRHHWLATWRFSPTGHLVDGEVCQKKVGWTLTISLTCWIIRLVRVDQHEAVEGWVGNC